MNCRRTTSSSDAKTGVAINASRTRSLRKLFGQTWPRCAVIPRHGGTVIEGIVKSVGQALSLSRQPERLSYTSPRLQRACLTVTLRHHPVQLVARIELIKVLPQHPHPEPHLGQDDRHRRQRRDRQKRRAPGEEPVRDEQRGRE